MEPLRPTIICLSLALLLLGAGGAKASDDADPPEPDAARLEAELARVTAERDSLLAQIQADADRHAKASETQQLIMAIIADPAAYGSQDEVLDLLDGLAVPGIVYGDDAFGSTTWRAGWRDTLFGDVDATIHTWRSWLSDDGSMGGSMWTWSGSAFNGEPFDLQGIELSTFDDQGLLETITVYYPYEASEVRTRLAMGNEAELVDGT